MAPQFFCLLLEKVPINRNVTNQTSEEFCRQKHYTPDFRRINYIHPQTQIQQHNHHSTLSAYTFSCTPLTTTFLCTWFTFRNVLELLKTSSISNTADSQMKDHPDEGPSLFQDQFFWHLSMPNSLKDHPFSKTTFALSLGLSQRQVPQSMEPLTGKREIYMYHYSAWK